MNDLIINKAPHYNKHPSGVEVIEVVREMPFSLGNAFKYVVRRHHKGTLEQDIKKAQYYLVDYSKHPDEGWRPKSHLPALIDCYRRAETTGVAGDYFELMERVVVHHNCFWDKVIFRRQWLDQLDRYMTRMHNLTEVLIHE